MFGHVSELGGIPIVLFVKKSFRALARVIPQCGMVSQAVAFNMFLAFFSSLMLVVGLMSNSLRGNRGTDLAARLSTILPPGSWQLVSDSLLRREVSPWIWVLFGWVGTLLVGSQVMKLLMEGIHLIYQDRDKPSFLSRQLRGLLLFCVSILVWLLALGMSVFRHAFRTLLTRELITSHFILGLWTVTLAVFGGVLTMLTLALIYRVARPVTSTWMSVLPGAAVAAMLLWAVSLAFGVYVHRIQYGPVYGGLAAAIGLMVWMEFSAMVVFLGVAWNAESA